ncbi:TetR/AcrR family transcriptional regulator [Herbaspirillum sp. alder98]|uniref:TetR/AcrR family transcriptional regulator n=1 Tax=Herbaspirillum sp. alder98 TaxID=2913096 RepID=UPI001CD8FC48|nr:TetR/AcrR family transcriptional regulator [Herbaspirillum sp. alder98]MCA1326870.1 TetR/AcrR family transcriptional regulator [Herbaspirillum sp. alder98]
MAQIKKSGMREAILESAFDLFSRKGYTPTTMAEIARTSNMTVANLYVYFDSKLSILYEIYQPWLEQQLAALAESVRKFRTPRSRLRRIFIGIWGDIPAADHSFANALIEALAVAPKGMAKPNTLLIEVESFLTGLIAECLPEEQAHLVQDDLLAHVIWMAFDGFVINQHLGDLRDIGSIADIMTNLLMDGGVRTTANEEAAPVKRPRKKAAAK